MQHLAERARRMVGRHREGHARLGRLEDLRSTQKSRGFGFVTFERANAAAAALAAPQHELRGAQLALRVAQSHDPQWTPPVRVRRRRRQLSDGVVWLENFFSEEEQRALRDKVCAAKLDLPLVQLRRGAPAKELVRKMLVADPAKRATLDEALGHAWLSG